MPTAVSSSEVEEEYVEEGAKVVDLFCKGVIDGPERAKRMGKLMSKYSPSVKLERLKDLNRTRLVPMISECSKRREPKR